MESIVLVTETKEPKEIPLITSPEFASVTRESLFLGDAIIRTPDGKVLNEQQCRAVLLMEAWYLHYVDFFSTPVGSSLLEGVAASIQARYSITTEKANALSNDSLYTLLDGGLNEWFEGDFTLVGYAGCGKTALMSSFINRIQKHKSVSITMTAPTNKAVKVLKQFGKSSKLFDVEYQTIYSAMGMKLKVNDDGREEAEGDPDGEINIVKFNLAVLDEASMHNQMMYLRINGLSDRPRFIYMGDSKQLKPVGDKAISPVFSNVLATYTLDKVMRYPEGSSIAKLVTQVRDNVGQSFWIDPTPFHDGDAVKICDSQTFLALLIDDLESNEYQLNPDHVKCICYTNKVVDWINEYVHTRLYGNKADAFVPGERLVSFRPVQRWSPVFGKETILKNRFEVDVIKAFEDELKWDSSKASDLFESYIENIFEESVSVEISKNKKLTMSIPDIRSRLENLGKSFKIWQIRTSVVDEDKRIELNLVDPSERERVNASLDTLRLIALTIKNCYPTEKKLWKRAWGVLYNFRDSFDSVVHSYAITCHSAQGSSYNNVYVTERDLLRCKDPLERSQLHYVAYSRAMEKLVISM